MSTLMTSLEERKERIEKIRREEGEEAARRAEKTELLVAVGGLTCAANGAKIGTFIAPGIGTTIGAAIGYFAGMWLADD